MCTHATRQSSAIAVIVIAVALMTARIASADAAEVTALCNGGYKGASRTSPTLKQ
jgi:hypothetical protein